MSFTAYIQSAYACNRMTVRTGKRERGRRSGREDAPTPSRSFHREDSKAQGSSAPDISTLSKLKAKGGLFGGKIGGKRPWKPH